MSTPPPKPPKPPPKPPKPGRSGAPAPSSSVKKVVDINASDDDSSPSIHSTSSGVGESEAPYQNSSPSKSSKKTSIKIDEALRESMQALSKTIFTGSAISNAQLCNESVCYGQEDASMAIERLSLLNNLFQLTKTKSKGATEKTPLTGNLIREGFLVKKSRKSDDKVYGILTSEYFAYGNEEYHMAGPSTMEIRRIVPLTATIVTDNTYAQPSAAQRSNEVELTEDELLKGAVKEDTTAEEEEEAAMQIHILAKDKSFAVQLATIEERNSWFHDLTVACSAAQSQAGKIYVAEEMSPVWRQDKTTNNCEVCMKKFTFLIRKHHCRNCGKCVCENCLVEKIRIPSLDPRALFKVCSACSVKLKEERNYMR